VSPEAGSDVRTNLSEEDEVAASDSGETSSSTSVSPESETHDHTDEDIVRTTRSGKAFGVMQSRKKRLRQEAIDDPDMEEEDEDGEDEEADEDSVEAGAI